MKASINFLLLLLALSAVATLAGEDYYKILGVPRNADEAAIKKAFKKMSLKYHPDKNRDKPEWAREQYVKVANAYETLSDPEKRRIYDQRGEEGVRQHEGMKNQGGGGGFQGFSHEDIFSQFFGGGGGGGGFRFNFGGGGFHQQHHHQQRQNIHEDLWAQSDVKELTIQEMSSFYRREQVWIIFFYKSGQEESKRYKDVWKECAEKLYGIVTVAAVNCHEEKEDALCEEFGVYSTPQILVFPANIAADGIKYEGEMTYQAISNFATSHMESFVRLVNDDNFEEFDKNDADKNKVLLFTSRKSTPPLLKVLSKEYKGRLIFGEVRQSSKKLIEKFKIKKFPTLLVLTDGSLYLGTPYEGEFKKDHIVKFLREYAYATKQKTAPAGSGKLAELTQKMVNEGVCGESDEKLCFLYLAKSRSNEQEAIDAIASFAPRYVNDPINFYIANSQNIAYSDSFKDVEGAPLIVIIKGKRGRYVKYDGDLTSEKIRNFVDYVVSGSATFNRLKRNIKWVPGSAEL